MTFTADQYSQIAQGYEKAAADPLVASEKRADLAKKGEWFQFLAQCEREKHRLSRGSGEGKTAQTGFEAEPKSRGRSWQSMAPFLTTLWITGAVLYFLSTMLFTNAVNLFGTEDRKTPVREISQSVETLPKVASAEGNGAAEQANGQHMAPPEKRHAISPDQPRYESPALTIPSSSLPQEQLVSPAPSEPVQNVLEVQPPTEPALPRPSSPLPQEQLVSPPSEPVQEVLEVQPPTEMLTVTSAATIRNGPFTAAKKIGTATAGAELQVKGREKDWVQFIDPSSGNTGWIHSSLVAPASVSGAEGRALPRQAETPPVKPAKPKLAKKKPSAPAQVSQRQRAYADLPPDEEFLPPRKRGLGLLSRRRMLREGLMSPGFNPPD
jgi:hypothetical protein